MHNMYVLRKQLKMEVKVTKREVIDNMIVTFNNQDIDKMAELAQKYKNTDCGMFLAVILEKGGFPVPQTTSSKPITKTDAKMWDVCVYGNTYTQADAVHMIRCKLPDFAGGIVDISACIETGKELKEMFVGRWIESAARKVLQFLGDYRFECTMKQSIEECLYEVYCRITNDNHSYGMPGSRSYIGN